MKILVISDTHGRYLNAQQVIERVKGGISAVLHLGDMISDAHYLEFKYQELPFYCVAGNCDFYYSAAPNLCENKVIEFNAIRVFMSHGHREHVKRGYTKLAQRAKREGAQIAVCGHTHAPFNKVVEDVLCVNPGSITDPRGDVKTPSYAVIDIPDGENAKEFYASVVMFTG